MVMAELHKHDLPACLSRFSLRPPEFQWKNQRHKANAGSRPDPSLSDGPEIPLDTDIVETGIGGSR